MYESLWGWRCASCFPTVGAQYLLTVEVHITKEHDGVGFAIPSAIPTEIILPDEKKRSFSR